MFLLLTNRIPICGLIMVIFLYTLYFFFSYRILKITVSGRNTHYTGRACIESFRIENLLWDRTFETAKQERAKKAELDFFLRGIFWPNKQ